MIVCLTFDDGLLSHYEFVRPILKDAGLSATFFINGEFMRSNALPTMSWAQIREMAADFEIANHGNAHVSMPEFPDQQTQIEHIPAHFGRYMKSFCYPGYCYDIHMMSLLREMGYTHARSGCDKTKKFHEYQEGASGIPYNVVFDNPFNVQCLGIFGKLYGFEEFKKDIARIGELECGVFCFHNLDGEAPNGITEDAFRRCVDLLVDGGHTAVQMVNIENHFEYCIGMESFDEYNAMMEAT